MNEMKITEDVIQNSTTFRNTIDTCQFSRKKKGKNTVFAYWGKKLEEDSVKKSRTFQALNLLIFIVI